MTMHGVKGVESTRAGGIWLPMAVLFGLFVAALTSGVAQAHGLSESSKQVMADGGFLDFVWLGAEHMLTGYDHLFFLFGVVFFLTGFRDILTFITAFTLGHCITLLGATLAGISANPFLIDAFIALTVVYKGLENLGVLRSILGHRLPNLLFMVFFFGLVAGFGLSTRLQEIALRDEGLVSTILAFNIGVELGQVVALSIMLALLAACRSASVFDAFSRRINQGLVLAGVSLFVFQIHGFLEEGHHHAEPPAHSAEPHDEGHRLAAPHHAHGEGTHSHEAEGSVEEADPVPGSDASGEDGRLSKHGHPHGDHGHPHSDNSPSGEQAAPPEVPQIEEGKQAPASRPHSHGGHTHTH